MKILAIETSCDETALALLSCGGTIDAPHIQVLADALYSQVKEHAEYGGVFPALAKREHVKNLIPLLCRVLGKDAGTTPVSTTPEQLETIKEILVHERGLFEFFEEHVLPLPKPDIEVIAVTRGPGLEPALWVGINFAKALSYFWQIPLVPVNHMEGHIYSVLVKKEGAADLIDYPALALLVSGGHTELVRVMQPLSYEKLGETRDDAVGEAFDKVARLLSLPYPGGPEITRLAKESRDLGETIPPHLIFPRPMIKHEGFDFSFAGLKTAVLYKIKELGTLDDTLKRLIARAFQEAAIDVLIAKTEKALAGYETKTLVVGGGVVANQYLRERLSDLIHSFTETKLLLPEKELSTDNAVMIGIAGYLRTIANKETYSPYQGEVIEAKGTLSLGD